jgi:hypothetical protein
MTQSEFYAEYSVLPETKEQRLVLDLRDSEFSWEEIALVFLSLTLTPYADDWCMKMSAEAV